MGRCIRPATIRQPTFPPARGGFSSTTTSVLPRFRHSIRQFTALAGGRANSRTLHKIMGLTVVTRTLMYSSTRTDPSVRITLPFGCGVRSGRLLTSPPSVRITLPFGYCYGRGTPLSVAPDGSPLPGWRSPGGCGWLWSRGGFGSWELRLQAGRPDDGLSFALDLGKQFRCALAVYPTVDPILREDVPD